MAGRYIISLDVPGQETEIVVMTETGRVTRRERQPTTVPALLEVVTQVRRPRHVVMEDLKNAILGAAKSVIVSRDNPLADQYWRYITDGGLKPRVARRSVARSQAAVMWGMWKTGSVYEPERVGVCAWAQAAAPLSS